MKNPLNKRFKREIKSELPKYIILFLFIVAMISIVSGFLVASNSMIKAYDESFDKYNIEHGNFELIEKADNTLISKIEKEGLTLYENFYLEEETNLDTTLRIFINRETVNKVCLMAGEFPKEKDEIAIDRLHAEKNQLEIGDTITVAGKELNITGLVALTDYSALYQNPTDTMFDTIKFGVSIVTEDGFQYIGDSHLHYSYSWIYDIAPTDDIEAKEMGDELLKKLYTIAPLESFIPAYSNQAIQFTGTDIGRDSASIAVFLYILIAIIAFIFAITTSNTITKEATVIGTLRASGYSKMELIIHYLTVPMLVTLISAIVGNILGYTVMEDVAADMYYNSYCLTTYDLLFNERAFVLTTVVPLILMFLINFLILVNKFKLSPLRFIRRDLGKRKKKKAFKLNTKIGIMKRFRIRIIFQNMPNYITIIIGIFLANIIMVFGNAFPALLTNYGDEIIENMICDYQYILKAPVETDITNAEKYTAYSLITPEFKGYTETAALYGVSPDSKYIDIDLKDEDVYISNAYASKYDIEIGDTITLKEEFADTTYSFTVTGIYEYPSGIALFMPIDALNSCFDFQDDYFNGYFTNEKLTDVDEKMIASVITKDDMTKTTRQLMDSMGGMIDIFFYAGIAIFMLVIYLLSKIIVEKNAQSISMIKILGYTPKEINKLYVITTAIVVIGSLILTMPIVDYIMKFFVELMFFMYSGWLAYYMPVKNLVLIALIGIVAYSIIAYFQMKQVKKIPMEDALKNVE